MLKYITTCKLQFSANLFPRPIYLLGKRNKSSSLVGYSASAERLQLCSLERGIWEHHSEGAPVSASHPGPSRTPPMLLLCCPWVRVLRAASSLLPSFPPASSGSSRSLRRPRRFAGARDAGLSPGCPGAACGGHAGGRALDLAPMADAGRGERL